MEIKEYQNINSIEKRQFESFEIRKKHKDSNLIPLIILKQYSCQLPDLEKQK